MSGIERTRNPEKHVDLVDAFTERASACAYLWAIGEYTLHEAIDKLQADAARDGLIDRIGQDGVEQVLAEAFRRYQGEDDRHSERGDDPRADVPAAESADEFGIKPEVPHSSDAAPAINNLPVAFPLQAFENISLDTGRRNYLVKGLLANSGLAVIWGPPKCGKSFWAADLGMHIALGGDYRGHKVQQASVVYVALEGRHGFPARIEAFRRHHGVESAPFYLLSSSLDLVAKSGQLIASIKAQLGKNLRASYSWTLSIDPSSAPRAKTRTWLAF